MTWQDLLDIAGPTPGVWVPEGFGVDVDPGPTAADCPPELGPAGDEYDWLQPDAPEDPDRSWSHRDSGE